MKPGKVVEVIIYSMNRITLKPGFYRELRLSCSLCVLAKL